MPSYHFRSLLKRDSNPSPLLAKGETNFVNIVVFCYQLLSDGHATADSQAQMLVQALYSEDHALLEVGVMVALEGTLL